MNYKAIALGAAIGFVFALTPSCSGTPTCSTANCAGCCNGDTCITTDKENNATCGLSGNACTACNNNQVCTAGTCQNQQPATDGGNQDGGAACGPSNCTGCCTKVGCLPGTSFTNCGTAGAVCSTCTAGQTCTSKGANNGGACMTPDAGPVITVGQPCTQDSDCSGAPNNIPDGICKKTTTLGNATYTNGYCTKRCTSNTDCGSNMSGTTGNAFCAGFPGDIFGEEDSICWDRCSQSDMCRTSDSYACYTLPNGGPSGCWISPLPVFDGGWNIGTACTSDSDCHPPTSGATCQTEQDAGFPGGYCSGDCFDNPGMCGSENWCLCRDMNCTTAFCAGGCDTPGDHSNCRPSYTCFPVNGQTRGFCFPDCTVSGCDADAGETCGTNGFCMAPADAG